MATEPEELDLADQLVVVRCQLGERQAFDMLVRRWAAPLHRYTRRLTGDDDDGHDLAQESWLRALRGLPGLREPAQFRSWLFGIAHRVAMDRLRARYATPMEAADVLDELAAAENDDWDDRLGTLDRCLAQLPPIERDVLILFYREERRLTDIARLLSIPIGTVKSRLHRARHLLHQHLTSGENQ